MILLKKIFFVFISLCVVFSASACSSEDNSLLSDSFDAEFVDGWVKAATVGDGLTSAYGTLKNLSKVDAKLVKVAFDIAEGQLHEVVDGQMSEIDGGLDLKKGESIDFTAGGYHLMLVNLEEDLIPGDIIFVYFFFEDDSYITSTLEVREYSGADEDYGDLDMQMDMSESADSSSEESSEHSHMH